MRPDRLEEDLCNLCGLCDEVCGRGIFTPGGEAMRYDPEGKCIDCGHCMAVCPEGALVRADGTVPPALDAVELPGAEQLLHFLRSRRSARKFQDRIPGRTLLKKLIEAARFAPTGTNKQAVKIVMVTDPARLDVLREKIMARYASYERHLDNPIKRFFLKLLVDRRLGDPAIRAYLHGFLDKYREGRDPLFHRAPVVAFLFTGKEASTAKDDCVLALYHMVLMAERIGLGSCLLGTVEVAFSKTPALNDLLGVPRDRPLLASACFGFPAIKFERLTDRKDADVTWL
jgi:nitroreductase/NAD-dependent dihydropyrimidine dehydrogenase PreA subunit